MGREITTGKGKRIEILDILRGFALAGILYAHMVFWYTGAALPPGVYFKYDSLPDNVAFAIFGAFVFGKFFSVFSFLFGLGFYLYFHKRKDEGNFNTTYLWRMFLLLLIGLAHHSLWRGDILAVYAVLGMLLLFFRRLPTKLLALISLFFIINLPTHIYELFQVPAAKVEFPMASQATDYYMLIKSGDLQTVVTENTLSWAAKMQYQLESGRFLMTLGYFLLGLYAGRRRLFRNIEKNLKNFQKWNKISLNIVLILLTAGLLMYLFELVTLPQLEIAPPLQWPAGLLFSIYNASLTIFFITGVSLLYRKKVFQNFLSPLGVMGRMALTNYLLQTVFGLLIFYQFGLGLFDQTSPAINILVAILIFHLQLKFSQLWLRHFKQGPVEWLWRSLTYFKFKPNRRKPKKKEAVMVEEVSNG
ncbi:DUF418 domain-containing protein [Antarcticibacterium flavum]|uniref:DUF418 domain-containing protein n=1 Tax=Antarcticibacterium flavum TaxID=2058175 RepID=A0A5B7WZF9_9FLAO|nr:MULTISPECIES: DUF418 domain-containing protein [Antarcticibacterium]MCM4161823.1 DUF418 domain-containing protein [Antarcticibacterium sp. W02-3]QCY68387.1 DUF418 domain-containing protein [Antarcticibacterium flavum]